MNYITTTQLRTKSSELIKTLSKGQSVELIHRSQVIGEIKPKARIIKPLTVDNIRQLKKLATAINLPKTPYKQREKLYRKHLTIKYGKGLS